MSTVPVRPLEFDFDSCSPIYGRNLLYQSCFDASSLLPSGNVPVVYNVRGHSPFRIPWQGGSGDCKVVLEIAGPAASATPAVIIAPDDIRGMAFWLMENCVRDSHLGGYVTRGLARLTNYVRDNPSDLVDPHWPQTAWFLTLSIEDGQEHKPPGNYDWMVPLTLAHIVLYLANRRGPNMQYYSEAWYRFANLAVNQLSATWPWWGGTTNSLARGSTAAPEETYECDSGLGAPRAVDCSQLDSSQFGAPSDSFQINPGVPKVLSSNDCVLDISTAVPIAITWAQVKTTFEGLMGLCVFNPLMSSAGGRAYSQGRLLSNRDAMAQNNLAFNILPPHVNLTIHDSGHLRL